MKIRLKKYFNTKVLVDPEKAEKFCCRLKELFKIEKNIILDFSEIKGISQLFLYVLFTSLWKTYGKALRSKITIINPPSLFFNQLKYLKDNYGDLKRRYASFNQKYRLSYV